MKTWFNGDNEGKIKRGGSRKGTLSDELNKADRIGKQLRYNEDELTQVEQAEQKQQAAKATSETKAKREPLIQRSSPFPVRKHNVEEAKSKDEGQVKASETKKVFQMSSPFPPRKETHEEVEEKPLQMSSPFPPRKETYEEAQEKPLEMSSPFPPRREAYEETKEEPLEIFSPFSPRIEPSDNEPNMPWHNQTLKPDYTIQYASKDIQAVSNNELAKSIIEAAPKEMEIELSSIEEIAATKVDEEPYMQNVTALGDMQDYSYSDSYEQSFSNEYEEEYEESYSDTYQENYSDDYISYNTVETEPIVEEEGHNAISSGQVDELEEKPKEVVHKLKSNIVISFEEEDTLLLNINIASVITILNSSGEQFDFKITNDGKGGQNLNIVAPSYIIGKILALFE